MSELIAELLDQLANGRSLAEVWDASRKLMRDKGRGKATDDPLLLQGIRRLAEWSTQGDDLQRLVAIDLLVRIPASIRKIARAVQPIRKEALQLPIPPLSVIAEKRDLPAGAEPAEIRENVATALADGSGDWVLPYVVRALAEEDRSQRCRVALASQIAQRTSNVDDWFERLLKETAIQNLSAKLNVEAGAIRLRDITFAFADTIKSQRYRLEVSARAGRLLSDLARTLVPLGPRDALPKRLTDAAAAAVTLLDELLALRLTLMDEPELYEVLEPIRRWWSQTRYPPKLAEALNPIIDKVMAGIVFRSRGGQRSDRLMQRLRQALNDDNETKRRLAELAKNEPGLPPEIQDWLLGIDRRPSRTGSEGSRLLTAVAEENFIRSLAPAFLLAHESVGAAIDNKDAARLAEIIRSLGTQFGLAVIGKVGDVVEFSPAAHEHVGVTPTERHVTLVQPPVLRRRADGGHDIILRGLVRSA